MDDQVTLLGIRHHGPGCAHALTAALEQLKPDLILLEGAAELQDSWALMAAEGMTPPVAQLVYDPQQPRRSVIYPWASFSPEWQAMRYAIAQGVDLQMMDLPVSSRMALEASLQPADEQADNAGDQSGADAQDGSTDAQVPQAIAQPEADDGDDGDESEEPDWPALPNSSQMLDRISAAAGFSDHEIWWDAFIERHSGGLSLFAAIHQLMSEARAQWQQQLAPLEDYSPEQQLSLHIEQVREAWMRKQLTQARKSYQRIVVVCGAWHVPALAAKVTQRDDNALLKGLKKQKMDVAWIPYNFQRLSQQSGYGAGVESPAWYQHLFDAHQRQSDPEQTTIQWLIRAAGLLRQHGFDCSSAHVIEAVRLSMSLALLRGQSTPGLPELTDAIRSVMTEGREAPLAQIQQSLLIGGQLGQLPDSIPMLPLEQDLENQLRALRLKRLDTTEHLTLDLRKDSGLNRSRLFRRLQVLQIPWARPYGHQNIGKGTFKEEWVLKWPPEAAIALIDASLLGHTIEQACRQQLQEWLQQSQQVSEIVGLIDQLLLCHLPDAVEPAVKQLSEVAALSADLLDMMNALLPMVQLMRYGSVRQIDSNSLGHVVESIVIRACNGLAPACACLDEDASYRMLEAMENLHSAIKLLDMPEYNQRWLSALAEVSEYAGVHGVLRGRTSRMLHEQQGIDDDELNQRFRLNVSACEDVDRAAAWVEGMMFGAAASLLYDDVLFKLLDQWLMQLAEEDFRRVLPLVRRTFSSFDSSELNQIGARVIQDDRQPAPAQALHYHPELAASAIEQIAQLLGLGSKAATPTGVSA